MELRHLKYFLAVADELHFGRASERLGIAQPPLSQQIKRLESELGLKLFERTKRNVALTAAGNAMKEMAVRVIAQAEDAIQAAKRAHRGDTGWLNIGFVGSAAYTPVAAAIRTYMQGYPDVLLTLHEERTPKQIEALLGERIDIGIVRSDKLVDEQLAVQVLIKERFVLALWKAHAQARNNLVALRTFNREGFVLYPQDDAPGLYRDAIATCQKAGFYPRHSQQASQIPTILAFVAAGLGVALLPASIKSIRWPGVVFRPLSDIKSTSVVALAWRKAKTSPVVEKFINVVSSEMNRIAKTE